MCKDLEHRYGSLRFEYLLEALETVVKSGELAAEHGDEFDEITIGRAAYDCAASALRKIKKEEEEGAPG